MGSRESSGAIRTAPMPNTPAIAWVAPSPASIACLEACA